MNSGKNSIVICSTNDRFAFEDGTISETLECILIKKLATSLASSAQSRCVCKEHTKLSR